MIELLKNMKPVTKIVTIVCVAAIVIALIVTGQLNVVLEFFK